MTRIGVSFWTRAVSVLCALALVFLSFAHRPNPNAAADADPAVAAYLAAGGSLADLCLSGGTDGGPADHHDCPACTLAKTMALGPAVPGPAGPAVLAAGRVSLPELPLIAGHGPRAPPARGPPPVQLI